MKALDGKKKLHGCSVADGAAVTSSVADLY